MTTKIKVQCPYADKCIDEGKQKCSTCVHNEKRSYYKHYDPYPWQPYYPYWPYCEKSTYEPWKPYWTVTYGGTSDDALELTSYYQGV